MAVGSMYDFKTRTLNFPGMLQYKLSSGHPTCLRSTTLLGEMDTVTSVIQCFPLAVTGFGVFDNPCNNYLRLISSSVLIRRAAVKLL
jgi:hypothetical protein